MAHGIRLDIDAFSGICGSISIACWIVVFTPQILENFRRSSASGLSLTFVIIWLLGDVFNILGAIFQNVLPTMTILAVYYTLADTVLLGQCLWYRGFKWRDEGTKGVPIDEAAVEDEATEHSSLLSFPRSSSAQAPTRPSIADADAPSKRGSFSSFHSHFSGNVDATHLSPATPFFPLPEPNKTPAVTASSSSSFVLKATLFKTSALLLVCVAGVLGWWLSNRQYAHHDHRAHHNARSAFPADTGSSALQFDLWGQIFGYLCAILYLGSRIPQLLLNHRRKSVEGVSMLFFLFACVGNLTYVLSIFIYEPACARLESVDRRVERWQGCERGEWREEYGRYILVNASWLVGSAGTLVLDLGIFAQFWVYRDRSPILT